MGQTLTGESAAQGLVEPLAPPRAVNYVLPADLASVGEARSLVRAALTATHLATGLESGREGSDDAIDDIVLVASELVSNALRHGLLLDPGCSAAEEAFVKISLVRTPGHLICAVSDPSRQPPVRGAADPMSGSGQGLALVESLTVCWGWSPIARAAGGGKSVWAIFPLVAAQVRAA